MLRNERVSFGKGSGIEFKVTPVRDSSATLLVVAPHIRQRRVGIGQASSDLVDLFECASLSRLGVATGTFSKRTAGPLNEL